MIGGVCAAGSCIDAAAVGTIVAAAMGVWAAGFGIGKTVAWVREILNAV